MRSLSKHFGLKWSEQINNSFGICSLFIFINQAFLNPFLDSLGSRLKTFSWVMISCTTSTFICPTIRHFIWNEYNEDNNKLHFYTIKRTAILLIYCNIFNILSDHNDVIDIFNRKVINSLGGLFLWCIFQSLTRRFFVKRSCYEITFIIF